MFSILEVVQPASDVSLLTVEELRAAAGVTDDTQDAVLQDAEKRIAAAITAECKIASTTGSPTTLRQETLRQTYHHVDDAVLLLSRRHCVEIVSIVCDGMPAQIDEYAAEPESGLLHKLAADRPCGWRGRKIVVTYKAGFASVPDDLKQAAIEAFRSIWMEGQRDLSVKAVSVETYEVETVRTEYWAGALPGQSDVSALPPAAIGYLGRFRKVGYA